MIIERYSNSNDSTWNDFLKSCKNSHFMFNRSYMDYHEKRYTDHSLIIKDEKQNIIALFPANEADNNIYSHQGLTFGGFLVDRKTTTNSMLELFYSVIEYYHSCGFHNIYYKCIPHIYTSIPSDEDRYALFILNAKLYRRDVTTSIFRDNKLPYQTLRKRMIKKATKENITHNKLNDFSSYWSLLSEVLVKEHDAQPVHSYEEINLLRARFPDNIVCHSICHEDKIIAGVVMFITEHVAHCQYIAASDVARKNGALDYLIDYLINEVYVEKIYFDFGISNENNGRKLNKGLIFQKEGFGARAVVHDFYEININD